MRTEPPIVYAEERQQAIARLAEQRRRVSVAELATEFAVTTETVRRDLSVLETAGLVRRVHGGAVPAASLSGIEDTVSARSGQHSREKELIAKAAFDLLPGKGGSVLLDAGTTTACLAELLPQDRELLVITNSVPIAVRLANNPGIELHLLPGRVRPETLAAVGDDTVAALGRLRVDLAFLGTNGITVAHGLSTPDHAEAATKAAMVAAGRTTVALADATKVGQELAIRFAELDRIDVLVTDAALPRRERTALQAAGPEVRIA